MSNGGPTLRYSHVVRVWGKDNSNTTIQFDDGSSIQGTDCTECWMDIAVFDQIVTTSGTGAQYQATAWRFLYTEQDFDTGQLNNNVRMGYWKRIHNPQDITQWIEVPVTFRVLLEWSDGFRWQRMMWQFDNTNQNTVRNTLPRRVYHYDIDDQYMTGEASTNGDPNVNPGESPNRRKQPPRNPQDYLDAIIGSGSSIDKGQYVDVEVSMRWATFGETRGEWRGKDVYTQGQGTYYVAGHSGDPLMAVPLVPDPNA